MHNFVYVCVVGGAYVYVCICVCIGACVCLYVCMTACKMYMADEYDNIN